MSTPSHDPVAAAGDPLIEQRAARPLLAIAAEGDVAQFADAVDAAFPELFRRLAAHGVEPAGPPLIVYHRFEPGGRFAIDVAAPVAAGTAVADDRLRADALPAGRYVTHLHRGAYRATTPRWEGRDLAAAHARVLAWAESAGLRLGRCAEQYLAGPPTVADPADWLTELVFLIEA